MCTRNYLQFKKLFKIEKTKNTKILFSLSNAVSFYRHYEKQKESGTNC